MLKKRVLIILLLIGAIIYSQPIREFGREREQVRIFPERRAKTPIFSDSEEVPLAVREAVRKHFRRFGRDLRPSDSENRGKEKNLTTGEFLIDTNLIYTSAPSDQGSPSIAFDGTNYFIVWEDERNGYPDIYGARVSRDGVVLDPNGIPVSTQTGNQFLPKLAKGLGNQCLIVYSGWTDSINNRPARTYRIWGKFYPFTGIEERFTLNAKRPTLKIYPNPAKSFFVICSPLPLKEIKIFDVSVKLVKEIALSSARNEVKISIKEMSDGVYILKIGNIYKKLTVTR